MIKIVTRKREKLNVGISIVGNFEEVAVELSALIEQLLEHKKSALILHWAIIQNISQFCASDPDVYEVENFNKNVMRYINDKNNSSD